MSTHALAVDAGVAARGIDLRLWLVRLDESDASGEPLLVAAERERASRFVRASDRSRYLASHAAVRRVLASGQAWLPGPLGKPALPDAAVHFNLSRRDGVALIGVSRTHELGVDIETLRPIDDAEALAQLHFTPGEREAIAHADAAKRDRAFLRVWTRKEACMKATGLGLSLPPSSFECGAQAEGTTVRVHADGQFWALWVQSQPALDASVVAAWAVVLARGTAALP